MSHDPGDEQFKESKVNYFLLRMLRERSYKRGEFKLASGRTSDFYIDCKKTFMKQRGLVLCGEALVAKLRHLVINEGWGPVAFVGGTGVGGGPLAAAVVMVSNDMGNTIDMVYVRSETKDHGTRRRVEPDIADVRELANRGVVLVEDVITTGGSAIEAAHALRETGYNVEGIIALVDRQEGGVENITAAGYCAASVFTKTQIVEGP